MSQKCFRLHKLFEKSPKVSLSVEEIADFYGESLEQIHFWIQGDIYNGMIFKEENRSNYYLTPMGQEKLYVFKRKQWAY